MKHSKKIVISGGGEVGSYAAQLLSENGHSVTIIDESEEVLERLDQSFEAKMVAGSACHANVLKEAQVDSCDVMIAATSLDEINILSGALGKRMGAKKVISRIHHRIYQNANYFNYETGFGIDHLIYPEELTARAICSHLNDPGVMAIQSFAKEAIELHQYHVDHHCKLIHLPLREVTLPAGIRIIKILRQSQAIIPGANSELLPGDIVTLIGPSEQFSQVKGFFVKDKKKTKEIVIVGGSPTAEWVIAHLKGQDVSIRLFELNLDVANELAARYPRITVLHADALDSHTFDSEHLERAQALLALSDVQERNILVGLQAKKLGVQTTYAVIHNSSYLSALEEVGINFCYSPRMEAAKELLRLMDDSPIKNVTSLGDGQVNIYELTARMHGAAIGQRLIDVKFPSMSFIAAIQRGKEVFSPGANDTVEPDDTLIIIGPKDIESTLLKLYL